MQLWQDVYLVWEVSQLQILCQDVQHAHHLREDEYSVARVTQPRQQLVQ